MPPGPELALLAAGYGWEPSVLRELTLSEVEYYLEHLPLIEARKHHGIAQLIADFREMFFPRFVDPDPDEKPSDKPPRRREAWTVQDTLPPHAYYPAPPPMPLEAAQALVTHYDALPSWAQSLVPIKGAQAVVCA